MPRQRKQAARKQQANKVSEVAHNDELSESGTPENSTTATPTENTNTTSNKGERTMAGLTPEQINALLSNSRSKGGYIVKLNEFVNSGEAGVCANETWAELANKKASTLKQGFEGAKTNKEAVEGADKVKVITNDDKVYLLNLALVQATADAA